MATQLRSGKLIFGSVCTLGLGLASAQYFPNTVFLDSVKEVVQLYRSGTSVAIPSKTCKIIDSVMADMEITPNEKICIEPFTVYGFDVFHAGYSRSGFGALIGIPCNFYYSTPQDVQLESITVCNESIDWATDPAQRLKKSLILSENAQKFLIAREIATVQLPHIYLKTLNPIFNVFLAYTLISKLNKKFNLLQRPRLIRSVIYGLVCLFSLGLWSFMQDMTTFQVEMEADKRASSLGETYVKGGVEAYSQIQQRNIALRELMGSRGSSAYTATGNNNYFFRQKHAPLTLRKEFLETVAGSFSTQECQRDSISQAS